MRGVQMGRIRARFFLGCVALVLGLAACSPNSQTSVSTAAGFSVFLTASPNTIPAIPAGADKGGCSTLTAKVFDTGGRLVDGAVVLFNTTLGIFPKQQGEGQDAVARFRVTLNGIATEVICAQAVKGTATVSATVEDAHATVLVTIF